MILHGKALLHFNEWLYKSQTLYAYNVLGNKIISNAIIIEWLDSVEIYITTKTSAFKGDGWQFSIVGHHNSSYNNNSRQEATENAINKACGIYNLKH